MRVHQRTNGSGPGSGSRGNCAELLRLLARAGPAPFGTLVHADQFFGDLGFLLNAHKAGVSGLSIMCPSAASRSSIFRQLDEGAVAIANCGVRVQDARADIALASQKPLPSRTALVTRLQAYQPPVTPPHSGNAVAKRLLSVAETVVNGGELRDTLLAFTGTLGGLRPGDKYTNICEELVCGYVGVGIFSIYIAT